MVSSAFSAFGNEEALNSKTCGYEHTLVNELGFTPEEVENKDENKDDDTNDKVCQSPNNVQVMNSSHEIPTEEYCDGPG
ncbi:hypothetical protein Tco_0658911 [Tanacetum coccineum]